MAIEYRVSCPKCNTGTYVAIGTGQQTGIAECYECGHRWEAEPR